MYRVVLGVKFPMLMLALQGFIDIEKNEHSSKLNYIRLGLVLVTAFFILIRLNTQ